VIETEPIEEIGTDDQLVEREIKLPPKRRLWVIWVAAAVIVLDQISKYIIENNLPLYKSWAPFPEFAHIFRISHVSNTGIAFGLFPGGSSLFAWAAVIVTIAILIYNFTLPDGHTLLRIALGLQVGGALGNFIDRMRMGHVTDFLDFSLWPVFNLSDLSVVSGALLLALIIWQEDKKLKQTGDIQSDDSDPIPENRDSIDTSGVLNEWSAN